MTGAERDIWFVREVLPLEPVLERFLRRNWRDPDEISDLRQEVYARLYECEAAEGLESVQAFLLTTARHLLIDRARRAKIVSIEVFADLEMIEAVADEISVERRLNARSELRLLEAALGLLPARCRQVVELRKIEGLSQREVAARMSITEDTVERQVSKGVRMLANAMSNTGRSSAVSKPEPQALERQPKT